MDIVLNYIGYIFFVTAGVVSVSASALIEYKVVSEFMSSKVDKSFSLVAFFVVFAAEIVKVFSIYLNKWYTISEEESYTSGNIYKPLRFALITLSVVCTMVFLFSELHNPEYEEQVNQAIQQANALYENRLANINADYEQRLEGISSQVKFWQQELAKEVKNVQGRTSIGARFEGYKLLYDESVRKLQSRRRRLEHERSERVGALERWHQQGIAKKKESLRTDTSSHNSLISDVLELINGTPLYPRQHYMLVIVVFSLLVSIVLELIIVYVFHVLAVEYGDLY